MIPLNMDIVIEFHCPEVDDETKKSMIKAVKNNFGMDIDDADYDISKTNKISLVYGLVGLILLIINLLTEKYIGPVLSNFICVVWWVAIWDMIEILFIENQEIKWKRLNNQQLYDSTVTFVFEEKTVSKPIKMVYTGNLIIGRDKTLALIADILNKLNRPRQA